MNRLFFLFFAAVLTASLSACGNGADAPLAGASIGGSFTLQNQDGETVQESDFAGKYRIIYFGYTHCPDVCPLDMQNIAAGLKLLDKEHPRLSDRIVPIFITVDPARDDVAAVSQFVTAFDDRIVGLTGTPEQIADVTEKYAVWYQKQETGNENYLMNHSRATYLMGPENQPIALVPADESPQAVAETLVKWVQ
ncbi:SCO family protein [Stakelama tenebrarum]|nr:SCO family protein [Sphingosinithalassobacter tenebrarum]